MTRGLADVLDRGLQVRRYMRATGNVQGWKLFAPDPPLVNMFVKVLVEDSAGRVWDLRHDIHGGRAYPYLFFDRMATINRLLFRQPERREPYAAWACRDWERTRREPARQVRLVRRWTRVPPPEEARRTGGFEPGRLRINEAPPDAFPCASIPHGQLPNDLRSRYGLPPAPDGTFREVAIATWRHGRPGGARGGPAARDPGRRPVDVPGDDVAVE